MQRESKISPLHFAAVNHHFPLQNAVAGFGGLRATFCRNKTGLRAVHVYTGEVFENHNNRQEIETKSGKNLGPGGTL
jgi:hypothetical protein